MTDIMSYHKTHVLLSSAKKIHINTKRVLSTLFFLMQQTIQQGAGAKLRRPYIERVRSMVGSYCETHNQQERMLTTTLQATDKRSAERSKHMRTTNRNQRCGTHGAKCKEQKADEKLKDVEQQERTLEQREMALTERERGIDMEVADRVGKTENNLLQEFIDYAVAYGAESRRMVKDFIEKVHEREENHEQKYDEELDDESIDR